MTLAGCRDFGGINRPLEDPGLGGEKAAETVEIENVDSEFENVKEGKTLDPILQRKEVKNTRPQRVEVRACPPLARSEGGKRETRRHGHSLTRVLVQKRVSLDHIRAELELNFELSCD